MKRLIAALLLTATPALSLDLSAMSDSEKTAFGKAVREYLMANPEVLIESINVLEERRAAETVQNDQQLVAANKDALFNDGHSWVGGNPEGDLTIVEFIDYRCGVCRRFNEEVHDLVEKDGNIRLILKEFPILGQDSDTSARFAVAVKQIGGDEAYMKAHDELIALRSPATIEALKKIADKIGMDADEVVNTMNTDSINDILRQNRQLAERMAIMGTPTFVVGDELLRGVPQAGLTSTVAEIRARNG
ncbi:DsbA family protein [Paracoccus seriniphilus]|uniref:Protein-disulfide isomerase n=1 Tax=Paracoccus seriniphilus TaxID=184748 RepID=A0A239PPI7_9RHOB|nr:DsbA family protein [Paracoccus seriniphilus]WCR14752.1 thioredoxin domain-containing protein [Paracoccus seriniphilus]SNT71842.1 Protein-disulfide isomerase [Paracoccus seriniphilus]